MNDNETNRINKNFIRIGYEDITMQNLNNISPGGSDASIIMEGLNEAKEDIINEIRQGNETVIKKSTELFEEDNGTETILRNVENGIKDSLTNLENIQTDIANAERNITTNIDNKGTNIQNAIQNDIGILTGITATYLTNMSNGITNLNTRLNIVMDQNEYNKREIEKNIIASTLYNTVYYNEILNNIAHIDAQQINIANNARNALIGLQNDLDNIDNKIDAINNRTLDTLNTINNMNTNIRKDIEESTKATSEAITNAASNTIRRINALDKKEDTVYKNLQANIENSTKATTEAINEAQKNTSEAITNAASNTVGRINAQNKNIQAEITKTIHNTATDLQTNISNMIERVEKKEQENYKNIITAIDNTNEEMKNITQNINKVKNILYTDLNNKFEYVMDAFEYINNNDKLPDDYEYIGNIRPKSFDDITKINFKKDYTEKIIEEEDEKEKEGEEDKGDEGEKDGEVIYKGLNNRYMFLLFQTYYIFNIALLNFIKINYCAKLYSLCQVIQNRFVQITKKKYEINHNFEYNKNAAKLYDNMRNIVLITNIYEKPFKDPETNTEITKKINIKIAERYIRDIHINIEEYNLEDLINIIQSITDEKQLNEYYGSVIEPIFKYISECINKISYNIDNNYESIISINTILNNTLFANELLSKIKNDELLNKLLNTIFDIYESKLIKDYNKIYPKINNIIAELYEVDKPPVAKDKPPVAKDKSPVAEDTHTKGGAINNCAKIKFIFKYILISLLFIIIVAIFVSICVISRTVYKRCDLPYY